MLRVLFVKCGMLILAITFRARVTAKTFFTGVLFIAPFFQRKHCKPCCHVSSTISDWSTDVDVLGPAIGVGFFFFFVGDDVAFSVDFNFLFSLFLFLDTTCGLKVILFTLIYLCLVVPS